MSNRLQADVAKKVREVLPAAIRDPKHHSVWRSKGQRLNVRTRGTGRDGKFWFDVTPRFYIKREIDFFVFACGSSEHIYVIPAGELETLISAASLGGAKQVPNFDFYALTHELVPAGASGDRHSVRKYYNAFELVSHAT